MTKISQEQASARLGTILNRTKRGESFILTRNGRPYARLVPVEADEVTEPGASLPPVTTLRHNARA